MAKDYVKTVRKSASRRGAPPARQNSNSGLWLLALLLIALFAGGLLYLKRHGGVQLVAAKEEAMMQETAKPAKGPKKPPAPAQQAAATPRFDFYTVLPKSKVAPEPAKPVSQSTPPPATANPVYILQLGIFGNYAAADKLKAHASLLGVETKINSFKKANTTFYRVWTGPYKTKAEAQQQQHELQIHRLKSQLVKQD